MMADGSKSYVRPPLTNVGESTALDARAMRGQRLVISVEEQRNRRLAGTQADVQNAAAATERHENR